MKKIINIKTREEVDISSVGSTDVTNLLKQAGELDLETAVVVGYENDGGIVTLATSISPEEMLYLAKHLEILAMNFDSSYLEEEDDE